MLTVSKETILYFLWLYQTFFAKKKDYKIKLRKVIFFPKIKKPLKKDGRTRMLEVSRTEETGPVISDGDDMTYWG